jgi:hypothetical protein
MYKLVDDEQTARKEEAFRYTENGNNRAADRVASTEALATGTQTYRMTAQLERARDPTA